ncbi:hypothetical protein [Luedemannella helvata]|uniref:CBM6 domain-containing protein n=1 Tax=Luedemannella helvata TaxID=349315 RepID=A0ABN2KQ14_9ACTN
MAAPGVGPADAQTQALPIVTSAPAPGLGWRDVRLSRQHTVSDDEALPVSRTRLMLVFGVLAVTALTTVVALTGGAERPMESVVGFDGAAGGSVFGDDPSFGSTPQRAPVAPPPPRPSHGDSGAGRAATGGVGATRQPREPAGARLTPTGVGHARRPGSGPHRAPPPRPAAPGWLILEAESPDNDVAGGAQRMRRAGVFNGGAVSGLGRAARGQPEGWLRFTDVRAPRPGRYAVLVYYLTPDGLAGRAVGATVRVDGRAPVHLGRFPPTREVRSKIVWVTLRQGVNTLRFGNAWGPAPVIDRVVVRPNG